MSITDELREWWVRKFPIMDKELHEDFTAIAYRIDAEHEESIQREHESAYDAGYAEGVGVANKADMRAEYLRGKNDGYDEGWDAGFASADDWLAQHEDEMAKHGWIRLPKDTDNVPWNVGDRDEDGNDVIALKLASDGWYVMTVGVWPYRPERHRHYHKPTVEDVLREFAYGLGVPVADSYIAASAAKLRLVEGEDA